MRIKIRVKPHSGRQEVEKIGNSEYKVSLKSLPEDNKANIELLKLMKKYFKTDVKIIKGLKSRDKVLEIL